MPNYKDGKVYELVCRVTGKRYIGSTTQPLSKRLYGHKHEINRKYKCKSSEIIAGGDYYINLLRACPVNTKEELHAEERKEHDKGECINKNRATITDEEHKEYNRAYQKEFRRNKKEEAQVLS